MLSGFGLATDCQHMFVSEKEADQPEKKAEKQHTDLEKIFEKQQTLLPSIRDSLPPLLSLPSSLLREPYIKPFINP